MGFGDLKKQLLKAGVVSAKQAKKAAHQERVESKQKGRDELDAEEAAKRKGYEAEQERKRLADQERERARKEAESARQEGLRVEQIARSGQVESEGRPNRRWYFVTRDGRVPYLNVDEGLGRRLESGGAALVEAPDGSAWAVSRETAAKLAALDETWLRWWGRPPGG